MPATVQGGIPAPAAHEAWGKSLLQDGGCSPARVQHGQNALLLLTHRCSASVSQGSFEIADSLCRLGSSQGEWGLTTALPLRVWVTNSAKGRF